MTRLARIPKDAARGRDARVGPARARPTTARLGASMSGPASAGPRLFSSKAGGSGRSRRTGAVRRGRQQLERSASAASRLHDPARHQSSRGPGTRRSVAPDRHHARTDLPGSLGRGCASRPFVLRTEHLRRARQEGGGDGRSRGAQIRSGSGQFAEIRSATARPPSSTHPPCRGGPGPEGRSAPAPSRPGSAAPCSRGRGRPRPPECRAG